MGEGSLRLKFEFTFRDIKNNRLSKRLFYQLHWVGVVRTHILNGTEDFIDA